MSAPGKFVLIPLGDEAITLTIRCEEELTGRRNVPVTKIRFYDEDFDQKFSVEMVGEDDCYRIAAHLVACGDWMKRREAEETARMAKDRQAREAKARESAA